MNTEDPTNLIAEGSALLKRFRFGEALRVYEQALALQTEQPQAWCGKSVALLLLDRNTEALEAAEHALQLDPASGAPIAIKPGHSPR